MHIIKRHKKIPLPSDYEVDALAEAHVPNGETIPEWVREVIRVAFQNGCYAEASAETFNAAFD